MTRRQRVVEALNHRETDLVPYNFECTLLQQEKMEAALGTQEFADKFGLHLHYLQYWGWPTEIVPGTQHFTDQFGVTWNRSGADKDIGVVDNPPIPDIENHSYTFPPIQEQRLRQEIENFLAHRKDCFTFLGIGFSVFERAWSLMGMENTFMAMIANPKELEGLLEGIYQYNSQILDIMLSYPLDAIYFGDDWGQQRGLMMGADHWRRFIKPVMKKLYARVKDRGLYVMQHSCGDIQEIFAELIDIGLDCYQTFQPEIYDIEQIKKQYGNQLSFWGGISTQQLLPQGTPEQVRKETIRIMKTMKPGGGYIAAPTHAMSHDIPVENVLAMVDVFANQEKYL